MTQTDPPRSPLDALWQADEPPARDLAFTAATLERATAADGRTRLARRLLTGLGVGGGVAGAVLMLQVSGADIWSLSVIAAAIATTIFVGGRLIAAG